MAKLMSWDGDAIASIDLPLKPWIESADWGNRRFRYIAISTTDTLKRLYGARDVTAVDLFCLRSDWELESCILDHRTRYSETCAELEKLGPDGRKMLRIVEKRLGNEWDNATESEFRSRSVITGYPMLATLPLVHREEVLARWGIDPKRPVIGIWSTPTSGRGYHGSYDWLFAESNPLKFYLKALSAYGVKGFGVSLANEKRCLQAIHHFARKHDAQVVVKARHYQELDGTVYAQIADRVVGEESYYPHTAVELACISRLMIGFRTSGYVEAVGAGCSFLNIEIPRDPLEHTYRVLHFWRGLCDFQRVGYSWTADRVISDLPGMHLDEFGIDPVQRNEFLLRYGSPDLQNICNRVVDAIEQSCKNEEGSR